VPKGAKPVKPKPPVEKPKKIGKWQPGKYEYSDKAMHQAMSRVAADPSSKAAQAEVREMLNALFYEEGIIPIDHAWGRALRNVYLHTGQDAAMSARSAAGLHSWEGRITVQSKIHKRATKFLKDPQHNIGVSEFRTVVHEGIHGCSPIQPGAYQGVGMYAEEASTEMAARFILNKRYGWTWSQGSYNNYINPTIDVMASAYEQQMLHTVPRKKMYQLLGRASVKMRSQYQTLGKSIKHGERWYDKFTDAIADELTAEVALKKKRLTDKAIKALRKKMRREMSDNLRDAALRRQR
jgi:hypothetical protein